MMFSSTVSLRKIDGSWARYPIPIRARLYIGMCVMSTPRKLMSPESGRISPMTI